MSNARELAELSGSYGTGGFVGMKNRIINGAMMIDQRNAGASVSVTAGTALYTLDRWIARSPTGGGSFSVQRSSTAPSGFKNSLLCTVTAPASVGASDVYFLQQRIEGFNVSDLGFGAVGAASVTVSFWVRSSLTGTFGASIGNNIDQSYPFSFTINSANTFEQKTVTIPGSTSGTWPTDNTTGLLLNFSLGSGSSATGTANTWGNYPYAPTGSINLIAISGATFYLTGVHLEKGSTATSSDYRPYGTELALCQRYYSKLGAVATSIWFAGYCGAGNHFASTISLPSVMRVAPTIAVVGTWAVTNCNQPTINGISPTSFSIYVTATTTAQTAFYTADAATYITASAEL